MPAAPAWSMGVLLLVTLALGHWWQLRWPWTEHKDRPQSAGQPAVRPV